MTSQSLADAQRVASYGRGGAGNIGRDDPQAHTQAADLVTPTLKSDHYTTGRGGSGNMARNDVNHPEIARAAQDVEAPGHREPDGPHHFGRGGAANIAKSSSPEPQVGAKSGRKSGEVKREQGAAGEVKGFVEKAKEFFGGKK